MKETEEGGEDGDQDIKIPDPCLINAKGRDQIIVDVHEDVVRSSR